MEEIEVYEVKTWYEKIKDLPAAYYLVAIQILVFVILHGSRLIFNEHVIITNFAKHSYFIGMEKEYYRLFTSIFIHESIPHIFFNTMALVYLAKPVEALFGKSKFIIIFLVAGIFGSLASFIFSPGVSIGASGGVFGIFGVHLYLYLKNKTQYLKIFGKNMLELLVLNVVIGFIMPNIDYWGHFGGILGGFLAATTLGLSKQYLFKRNFITTGLLTLSIFIGSFAYFNNNFVTYTQSVETLADDFNNSFATNNLPAFEQAVSNFEVIKEDKPFLPPTPRADNYIDQIEKIVNPIE